MAATGNEVVILKQLKDLYDTIKTSIATKVSKPTVGDGTSGQMLVTNGDGTTSWVDQPGEGGVGSGDLADNAVTTDKINDGAVTTAKIGNGAVTSDKIADGTIATGDIANDAITADKIADGVIPDVSGFITAANADGKYAAKSHTHTAATTSADGFMSAADKAKLDGLSNYVLPAASTSAIGGVKIVSDEDFKSYLGIS